MKTMQAREFRIALNDLTEPVEVFARSEKKGTWFPAGWDTPTLTPMAHAEEELSVLNDEIARLKRELATRPAVSAPRPMAITDALGTKFVQPARSMTDQEAREWLKSLPEQDRAFFASRFNVTTKKSGSDASSGD